ncbi:hypothetical protein M8818_001215 [Zalaria obscura]|uniref:Uncharacterized protein n=1 Tax=Zalaria obscura TaxID=2024903 RepID=A0ACC3SKI7_9PEZI
MALAGSALDNAAGTIPDLVYDVKAALGDTLPPNTSAEAVQEMGEAALVLLCMRDQTKESSSSPLFGPFPTPSPAKSTFTSSSSDNSYEERSSTSEIYDDVPDHFLHTMPPPTPTSASTSPTLRSNAWTPHEDAACIRIMKEVCNDGYDGTDLRFKEVAKRLKQQYGIERGANGVKNQWNRRLRAIAGYEDRGRRKRSDAMETSLLKQTRKVGRRRERIEKDARVIAVAAKQQARAHH